MKTKELIRQLQENDPTGEVECMVDGVDIHFVARYPGYYDGSYEVLIRDSELEGKCYNITGAKITKATSKLRLHLLSVEHMLIDYPEFPVTLDPGLHNLAQMQAKVEEWRKQGRDMETELQEWKKTQK